MTQSPPMTVDLTERAPEPPALLVQRDLRRDRLRVAFRLLLALPQLIVFYVLYLVGSILVVVGWFAALVLGRLPEPIARYLCDLAGYWARLLAYVLLLTDRYPPFQLSAEDYPVRLELAPGRLNRLAVLFRVFLAIPAAIVVALTLAGWLLASFVIWLLVLVLGRVPGALFDATTALLRYCMRYYAYLWMLTAVYPSGLFGDRPALPAPPMEAAGAIPAAAPPDPQAGPEPATVPVPEAATVPEAALASPADAMAGDTTAQGLEPPGAARRLVLSVGAKRLVVLFLVLGVAMCVGGGAGGAITANNTVSSVETLAAVTAAHDTLAGHGQKYQQDITVCSSTAEAQQLSCVQSADRELAAAFDGFATEVERLAVPASAQAEATEVARLGHQFAGAMQRLVTAPSREEYSRLATGTEQLASSFDQRYQALVNELAT